MSAQNRHRGKADWAGRKHESRRFETKELKMRNISTPILPQPANKLDALQHLMEPDAIAIVLRSGLLYSKGASSSSSSEFSPLIRFRSLLSLLTFAYARGIYASQEIELLCLESPAMRYLASGMIPGSQELVRFRRSAREALRCCLAQVLEDSYLAKDFPGGPGCAFDSGPDGFRPAGARKAPGLQTPNLGIPQPQDRFTPVIDPATAARLTRSGFFQLADQRIQEAIFADSMDLDS